MKVIFDTDPGIDDAFALLYLSRIPEVELLGITTVVGNSDVDTTTRNALFLRQEFGISAPVIRGAHATLDGVEKLPPVAVHGENGLGDYPISDIDPAGLGEGEACDFIVNSLRAHPSEVTIIAVGRMTNLALALRRDPTIAVLANQVVIMGGAFGFQGRSGNLTPAAEANIHGDPVAADEVMAALWPVSVMGLDVTLDIMLTPAHLDEISRSGSSGKLVRDISCGYERFYRDMTGIAGVVGHDLLAVTYAMKPQLFTTRSGPIHVLRDGLAIGQTLQMPDTRKRPHPDWVGRRSQLACVGVDEAAAIR